MKKSINVFATLVALALCTSSVQPSTDTRYPVFELWNKTTLSVTYEIGRGATLDEAVLDLKTKAVAVPKMMRGLGGESEWARVKLENKLVADTYVVRDSHPDLTVIVLAVKLGPGKMKIYRFTPGRNIYLTVRGGDQWEVSLTPQTGRFKGLRGKTKRGYPQRNNVKQHEIIEYKIDLKTVTQEDVRKFMRFLKTMEENSGTPDR